MFKYVADISVISHSIIENFLENKNCAIDATLGNGHDTDFLKENFKKVYSFDIQEEACKSYINEEVDCIMYNLGFLPGGNKEITTMHESSLKSIKDGLELLASGGIMTICIYTGHNEGKIEESCIMEYLQSIPKNKFGVMEHSFINRKNNPPKLVVVEKK